MNSQGLKTHDALLFRGYTQKCDHMTFQGLKRKMAPYAYMMAQMHFQGLKIILRYE